MKANATRRILSLVIALAMMIAPMTFGVSAADNGVLSSDAVAAEGQDPYVPDPDGDLVSADDVPFLERSADIARVDDLEPYEPDVDYIRGLPNEREELPLIPGESITTESRSRKLNINPNATNRFIDNADYDGAGEFTTKVVAAGGKAVIHLDTSVTNQKVIEFATNDLLKEFNDNIYPLVTGCVGDPVLTNYRLTNVADFTNAPINIVLYPINKNSGLITGGYFYSNDFINRTGDGGFKDSNEGAIVYIDVSQFFGQDDIINNAGLGVRGTLAHEFQHLVNYTYILSKYGSLQASDYNSNGNPARRRNTWLNEGISGYVEKEYFANNGVSMTKSHLQPFIADIIYDSIGFVPTDAEWSSLSRYYSTSARPYILSAYGSTAVLMQEFAAMGGNVPGLLNTTLVGYVNSLKDVGAKSKQGNFDEFFKEAALATGVSSPSGNWVSATGENLWQYRLDMTKDTDRITQGYQYDQFDGFAGIRQINGTVSYNSAKKYNSQVFLTAPIGTGYDKVTFTLPANLKGSYYLVSVTDPKTDASTAEKWIAAAKAPKLIENGVGYDVGVNNRFAVVAVNTSNTVSESFTYALSTNRPKLEVTATPDIPLISGTGGNVTLTMKALLSAIRPDPTACDLEVIGTDANGAVVAGITAGSDLKMDTTGTTTGTVVFDGTVPAGAYTLTVQEKGDGKGYIGSTAAPVMVNFNLELQSPGEGAAVDPSTLTAITVKTTHNGDKMAVATGRFTLTVNGDAYTATAAGSTAYSETLSIPLISFRNGNGDNALIPYGAVVALSTEVGSVGGETGAVNANTAIGSFTASAEGSDPSLIPGALSFDKTAPGFANFLVYFGDNSGYTEATVTSNNTSVVTVEPADVSQSGSRVKVVAHDADSTTLTIGFSGNDGELQTSLTMNVTVNGEKNNTGGGIIIRPGGNTGGNSSGGGGGSSSGGSGGGGGGGSDPFKPLTTTQATKDATTAITKAAKANDKTAAVRFNNISDISLETMKSMATLAEKAGVTLQVNVHTMVNGKTVMRQSFNPANATKSLKFGGSTTSGRAVGAASVFKKYFTNTTEIMALNQKDDFGMVVETAILTGSTVEKTVIYSHNGAKNQFKPLENPKTWKDKSGYLHFETNLAYNYVLSQGTLTKK